MLNTIIYTYVSILFLIYTYVSILFLILVYVKNIILYTHRYILRKSPHNADVLFLRGRALYLQGSTDSACAHYLQCLKVDPEHKLARTHHRMVKALIVCVFFVVNVVCMVFCRNMAAYRTILFSGG